MTLPTKILIASLIVFSSSLSFADLTAGDVEAQGFVPASRGPASVSSRDAQNVSSLPQELPDNETEARFCATGCRSNSVLVRSGTLAKLPLSAIHP